MNNEQHEHFHLIFNLLEQKFAEPKYEKGAVEHGGNIWDISDEDLEIAEFAEMIDLLVYRMTKIKRRLDNMSPQEQKSYIDKIRSGILR